MVCCKLLVSDIKIAVRCGAVKIYTLFYIPTIRIESCIYIDPAVIYIDFIPSVRYISNTADCYTRYALYSDQFLKSLSEIFCESPQNLVKQRITPHFLTTDHPNYYEFTTKG